MAKYNNFDVELKFVIGCQSYLPIFQTEADSLTSMGPNGEDEGAVGGEGDGTNDSEEGAEVDSSRGGDEEQDDDDDEEMYESSDQGMESLDFDQ